jgi:hypothetical protein
MSSLIKKATPKTPTVSAPITSETAEVTAAAEAEALRLKKRKGYLSTVLTGSRGVEEEVATRKETLG